MKVSYRHLIRSIVIISMLSLCIPNTSIGQPTWSKVFTPDVIGPGSVSTLTFTITNNTESPVTSLAFTDVLPGVPGAMTIANPANATTTCGAASVLVAPDGGGTITFTDGTLGDGESCTITVDVTASTPGTYTNLTGDLTSSGGNSGTATDDLTVDASLPGFSKSFSPSTVPTGGRSTLTFLIDNSANASNVLNLDFTDNLPAGMVIASPAVASTTCGTAAVPPTLTAMEGTSSIVLDADGTFAFPAVAAGATCTVTVDVVASGVGELDNISGELLASFVSAGKASATLEVTRTTLSLKKEFVDDPVPPGGTAELEFTLMNFDRDFTATDVAFTDDLDATLSGLTFSSLLSNDCGGSVTGIGMTDINLSGGTIAAGGSCTIRASLTVPAGATPGAYNNTTGAITGMLDGVPNTGNMASDILFVEPVPLLTKEWLEDGTLAPDPVVNPGDDVVLRFTVTNTSLTSGATDITFDDELTDGSFDFPPDPTSGFLPFPVSVTIPAGEPCGTGSSLSLVSAGTDRQALRLTGGSLTAAPGAGSTCTFDVTVSIPADFAPGTYLNTTEEITATVDGATRTGEPASDDLTVNAAPSLSKEFTDDPIAPGEQVTLEFTISHPADAPSAATDITFTDNLAPVLAGLAVAGGLPIAEACDPDGPGGDPGTGTLSESAGGTLLTFMGGSLDPGESCSFSVTLNVPAGAAPGSYTNTTSDVSATVSGLTTSSAPATDELSVAGLKFSKEFLGDPVIPGDTRTLRFTIENVHPTLDATITFFTDNLAAALPSLAATGAPTFDDCGGTMSGTTFLTYVGGSVMSGTSCTIDVEVLIPTGTADGTYNNTTSFLSANQGGAVSIAPAVDDIIVNSNLIQLEKSFTDDPVAPGDPVTLDFTLTNLDGSNAASMIDFTDNLGAALSGYIFDMVNSNDCGATVSGEGTSFITVENASLAAGGSCTISVSTTVPAAAAEGTYTNTTSSVTGEIDGFAVTGDAASDDLEVIQLLDFSKSFDGPTVAGGTAILTFTIVNPGINTATGVQFTDDLDAVLSGLIATSVPTAPCGGSSTVSGTSLLTVNNLEIAPMGGICTFNVEVTIPSMATAGVYPNTTSDLFQSGLKVAEPATADLTVEPPPTFAKAFAPDMSNPGDISTLTFTIDNSASSLAASALDFTDNLPAGVVVAAVPSASTTCTGGTITASAGTTVISYTGGTVGAGASCTVQVDVTTAAVGAYLNTTGDLTSSSGNSGTATDTWNVICDPSDASMISGTATVCEGSSPDPEVTFTFTGGIAPYTFTYNINGGTNQMVTTTMGNSVTVAHPTATPGVFTYNLLAAEDAAGCPGPASGSAVITINSLPTASIGGTVAVCEGDADPDITFTGADGTAPYTFTYTINGGANQMVTTTMGNSVTVAHSTATPGMFTYELVSVEDANSCSQAQSGSAVVTVNALPTASISGTVTVCEGDADPDVTFTGADGAAPYTFTYTINGGANQMVTTTMGNSVTVAHSTATPGMFTYELVSVEDANMCSQAQAGSAVVTVNALPTASISGTIAVCEGDADPDITFTGANGTAPYTFTYTVDGGPNQTVTTTMGNSVTVAQSTAAAGMFTYELVSVEDANMCSQAQAGSAVVTVNSVPTASISGTITVCEGDADPDVTFTGADGTAPYTFTYTINGGANQMVTTTMGNSVTVAHSTATPGMFTYELVSVEDANMCGKPISGSAVVTVNALPTASISGTTALCQNEAAPDITFTGAGGTAPYTFTYNINGGANQTITTMGGDMVTISQSTAMAGTFTYNLVSVEDANACSQAQVGSASITVYPLPTASISGTVDVCEGDAAPDITFTGADGTAPYTFTYTINGGAEQMITTVMGNSVTISQSTAVPGIFTYELTGVSDANMCSQAQSGEATVTVNPQPGVPGAIRGPAITCPGLDNLPFEVVAATDATSYDWTFTDPGVTINGNGTRNVSLDGVTVGGTLSVVAVNACGSSTASNFEISIATPEICVLADCTRNGAFIDDEILAINGMTDVFKVIVLLESDATILDTWFKIFRAGEGIVFYPPFTVENGGILIAEIESCFTKTVQINQKK